MWLKLCGETAAEFKHTIHYMVSSNNGALDSSLLRFLDIMSEQSIMTGIRRTQLV